MAYVDGFLVPVPKAQLQAYQEKARQCGEVWKRLGALSYVECVADDVPFGEVTSFPRAVQLQPDEVVIFSWITYESRQQRDAINEKVMSDPQIKAMFNDMPFDGKRMIFGGFETFLTL